MTISINNCTYSNFRVIKMLGSETEATKLRGWDKFKEWTGLGDKGQVKKKQLKELYDELHSDKSNHEVNNNINRLIVFSKMSELVNEPSNKDQANLSFRVFIDRPKGLSCSVTYKVDDYNLLTVPCNNIEERVIESLIKSFQTDARIDCALVLQKALTSTIINKHAGDAYIKAKQHKLAGDAYIAAKEYNLAVRAYIAAKEYKLVGDVYIAAKKYNLAAHAYIAAIEYKLAGDAYIEAEEYKLAGDEYIKAKQHKLAGDAYIKAKQYKLAGDAYIKAKQHKLAGDAYIAAQKYNLAAHAYIKAGEYSLANDADKEAKSLEATSYALYQSFVKLFT
jgi:tetratricopeptide (TPR) repeat protein